jgi:hypothetical protein
MNLWKNQTQLTLGQTGRCCRVQSGIEFVSDVDMLARTIARQTALTARSTPQSLVLRRGVHIENTVHNVRVLVV